MAFRFIVFLLSVSILLTGCHSFYEVPKDDYSNIEKMNDIKVVYKNGKEFVVEKDDTTNIKMVEDSLIVYQGIETKAIGMNEVEKIIFITNPTKLMRKIKLDVYLKIS